jgi:hypothetical protein
MWKWCIRPFQVDRYPTWVYIRTARNNILCMWHMYFRKCDIQVLKVLFVAAYTSRHESVCTRTNIWVVYILISVVSYVWTLINKRKNFEQFVLILRKKNRNWILGTKSEDNFWSYEEAERVWRKAHNQGFTVSSPRVVLLGRWYQGG